MDLSSSVKVQFSFSFKCYFVYLLVLTFSSAGWVEFSDKKIAKQVAESLNNTAIGGKKGDFYHDDIWNLKYLKNFK